MNEGETNNYFWVEIEGNGIGLPDLVTKCPELFIGRAVAITSFDSGPLVPDDEEKGYGWYSKDEVFYAPAITDPSKLPFAGYDEWYVFDNLKEFKPIESFVNNSAFILRDPICQMNSLDPTWDKVSLQQHIAFQKDMQAKFWDFIQRIQPRSFVMNGDLFKFGSRFAEDIELIKLINTE